MNAAARASKFSAAEIQQLRAVNYNATVTATMPVHSDLRIFHIVPDTARPPFAAGQFLTLGLGNWEPRVEGVDLEQLDAIQARRLAKRAYSISCSLLDAEGVLRRSAEFPYLEFYVSLVRHGRKRPPTLTPRLFALQPGARLFVQSHAAGSYTLDGVRAEDNVYLLATGTGEAPHNTMIAELLTSGHRGKIVSAVSVRYSRDAAYRACHEQLMQRHANYRYFVLATREPHANEPWMTQLQSRPHLQDLIATGQLARRCGTDLDPANTQVFLCGNAEMIGLQHATATLPSGVKPGSMLDVLLVRGFQVDQPGQPGSVHFERYW